ISFLRQRIEGILATRKIVDDCDPPRVVLMVGVNGVGKTTTTARLARASESTEKSVRHFMTRQG
ncbi:hypothetical protein OAS86_06080, partial [Gammaproteobacteria bacterium]|nr:hypothetical protein [Gammaproteobacteria bacterium]